LERGRSSCAACGFEDLPAGSQTYTCRNGRFFLEIVGHPEFGAPFGQDRLVLLWLATRAVRNKSPVVGFESAAAILKEWRLPSNGEYYRRLAAPFKRVFTSTIFFGTRDDRPAAAPKYGIAAGLTSSTMLSFGSPKRAQRGRGERIWSPFRLRSGTN
jgi:hypothetical protein